MTETLVFEEIVLNLHRRTTVAGNDEAIVDLNL